VTTADGTLSVRHCKIKKTSATIAPSSFRQHLFKDDPAAWTGGAVYNVMRGRLPRLDEAGRIVPDFTQARIGYRRRVP
jgi:hypothetical protein